MTSNRREEERLRTAKLSLKTMSYLSPICDLPDSGFPVRGRYQVGRRSVVAKPFLLAYIQLSPMEMLTFIQPSHHLN